MNGEKKIFFNIIDILILVAAVCITMAFARLFFIEGNQLNFKQEKHFICTVEIDNISQQHKNLIKKEMPVIYNGSYKEFGNVSNVFFENSYTEFTHSESGEQFKGVYHDIYKATVEISCVGKINDGKYYVGEQELFCGNSIELNFSEYCANGVIVRITEIK